MNHTGIENKFNFIILLTGFVFSIANLIVNVITKFPPMANIKWLILLLISSIGLYFRNHITYRKYFKFAFFFFVIAVLLPMAYIDSGGIANNSYGYVFVIIIMIGFLFQSWRRIFLLLSTIAVFFIMTLLEYLNPDFVVQIPREVHFVDRLIQIPLLFLVAFFIIYQVARSYEETHRQLHDYANNDELTGLYNRRTFNRVLDNLFATSTNNKVLALLDLDNFKLVNDQKGHLVGDQVLTTLANLLRDRFPTDKHIISRWGGDEFAIIYDGAREELYQQLILTRDNFYEIAKVYEPSIGVSIGIVELSNCKTVDDALRETDIALYHDKDYKRR